MMFTAKYQMLTSGEEDVYIHTLQYINKHCSCLIYPQKYVYSETDSKQSNYIRPNAKCHVTLGGQDVYIQTWEEKVGGNIFVGSSYPSWTN